jgi:hypothetical protein
MKIIKNSLVYNYLLHRLWGKSKKDHYIFEVMKTLMRKSQR